jgi:hypothetical protein
MKLVILVNYQLKRPEVDKAKKVSADNKIKNADTVEMWW